MTSSMAIAVDLAKAVFEIADASSRIVERHWLSRSRFQAFLVFFIDSADK